MEAVQVTHRRRRHNDDLVGGVQQRQPSVLDVETPEVDEDIYSPIVQLVCEFRELPPGGVNAVESCEVAVARDRPHAMSRWEGGNRCSDYGREEVDGDRDPAGRVEDGVDGEGVAGEGEGDLMHARACVEVRAEEAGHHLTDRARVGLHDDDRARPVHARRCRRCSDAGTAGQRHEYDQRHGAIGPFRW